MNQVFKFDLRESSAVKDNQNINGSFASDKQKRIDEVNILSYFKIYEN